MVVASALLVAPAASPAQPEAARDRWWESFEGEKAFVKPSEDAVMGFTLSTSVQAVLVSGGQRVKAGDVLIQGDDSEDVAEAKFQRARAATQLPVDRAASQLDLAELEYKRYLEVQDLGAGSPLERERARAARDTAKIDLDLAKLNQVLSSLQADRAEARVEKLNLRAPFDGIVDRVDVDEGQSVREGEPVLRLVSVDPVWIDVNTPTAQTISLGLEKGSPAWILMQEDTARRVYAGEVIEVAPTTDSASGLRRIRVQMANAVGVVPGVNCWVRFTEPSGEWRDRVVDPSKPLETAEAQR
jgi:RND family efflux transporter MFP subunit